MVPAYVALMVIVFPRALRGSVNENVPLVAPAATDTVVGTSPATLDESATTVVLDGAGLTVTVPVTVVWVRAGFGDTATPVSATGVPVKVMVDRDGPSVTAVEAGKNPYPFSAGVMG